MFLSMGCAIQMARLAPEPKRRNRSHPMTENAVQNVSAQPSTGGLPVPVRELTSEDLAALQEAVAALEHPGFAARLAAIAGRPVELLGRMLPAQASQIITKAVAKGLEM